MHLRRLPWLCKHCAVDLCKLWCRAGSTPQCSKLTRSTLLHVADHGASAVVVVNELRSESVHSHFTSLFQQHFTIKRTPRSKMDAVHQHSAIDILILKRRKGVEFSSNMTNQQTQPPP